MSIYQHVLNKLGKYQGLACDIADDKRLLILFVQLERSVRSNDFGIVEENISRLHSYVKRQNKEYLIIYGYMYLTNFDGMRTKISHQTSAEDPYTLTYKFDRRLTSEKFLIRTWAGGCAIIINIS